MHVLAGYINGIYASNFNPKKLSFSNLSIKLFYLNPKYDWGFVYWIAEKCKKPIRTKWGSHPLFKIGLKIIKRNGGFLPENFLWDV